MCNIFRQNKSPTIRKNVTKNHNFHMILTVSICVFFFTLFNPRSLLQLGTHRRGKKKRSEMEAVMQAQKMKK